MYVQDIWGNVINLMGKSFIVDEKDEWAEYDAEVLAVGPVAAWWDSQEMTITDRHTLHRGTVEECNEYMDLLVSALPEPLLKFNVQSTRREQPAHALEVMDGKPLPF